MVTILDFQKIAKPAVGNPAKRATVTAVVYILFCSAYIIISSRFAAEVAASTEEMKSIETTKGILFVAITGFAFYFLSLLRWQHIKRQEEKIIQQENALLMSERKSVAAMFAASLSHDLNNLLITLSALTDEIQEHERGNPELTALRNHLDKGITSLAHIAKRIVATAKHGMPEINTAADLRELLSRVITLMQKHPDLRHCAMDTSGIHSTTLLVNVPLLEEAVINLLINAGQAAGRSGRVAVRTMEDNGSVRIEVHDNGPGISAGSEELIFDPCYTTKPEGSGLGLLAVKAFAASCGGTIEVGRSDIGGAMFAIIIPAATGS